MIVLFPQPVAPIIPSVSPRLRAKEISETSKKAFRALGASGVVRIDYLYDKKAKKYTLTNLTRFLEVYHFTYGLR